MRIVRYTLVGLLLSGPGLAQDAGTVVFQEEGKASFYGDELKGQKTASGAKYDPDAMTAAHPTLPLGTAVTVTDPATDKQVEVEINDRGPFAKGRDIDLSKGAAEKLGIAGKGVAEVKIEATKQQVEQAIGAPAEAPKVQDQLDTARRAASAEGTPQPSRVLLGILLASPSGHLAPLIQRVARCGPVRPGAGEQIGARRLEPLPERVVGQGRPGYGFASIETGDGGIDQVLRGHDGIRVECRERHARMRPRSRWR